ncbi:MltF family protein [Labilibaculum euxinus]|uniref:Transporter substrate-binding domain-containing protein n=1 Tax=Labilibaculum euxinus TaxID=2686357 RepID=A0A7M4D3D2_9BACT|nr:transporter substrate-binding domain-containing protein [Labilibaculum euxinus]MUP37161.1 transporter substrate-binding domain-containing protein [Labilibaculum euxinus]MVB06366.1 transporter substrate-binding domain-containing protein [Labilibaculum euxinus]
MSGIKYLKLFIPVIFMVFLQTCNQNRKMVGLQIEEKPVVELKHVKLRGKLRVVTDYNSTNYFVYKGHTMGFQYEMLEALAKHLGVKLELTVNNDLVSAFASLERGDVDLLGMNLAVTTDRMEKFNFTIPHSQSPQVLIQRSPVNDSIGFIRNKADLGGKRIHVQSGSSFQEHLVKLSNEMEMPIDIVVVDMLEEEGLISMVASGEIDYTIADENVAMVNSSYYPGIDFKTSVSLPQNLAWALRKGANHLTHDVNMWLMNFQKTKEYKRIYQRYFKSSRIEEMMQSEYFTVKSGKISDFDDLLKEKAKIINWDWRLLSALISQESNFDPKAQSWVGAFGLMQLMPETAYRYDVDSLSSPIENVDAGVRHLKYLKGKLDETLSDKTDELKFLLASYNVGLGHVLDARRLAEKNGKNPDQWKGSVDYYLLNKSKPEFFNDPVVKYGYCRGSEPYQYVNKILERYNNYQNIVLLN